MNVEEFRLGSNHPQGGRTTHTHTHTLFTSTRRAIIVPRPSIHPVAAGLLPRSLAWLLSRNRPGDRSLGCMRYPKPAPPRALSASRITLDRFFSLSVALCILTDV